MTPGKSGPSAKRLSYTIQEAASMLGVSRRSVYELSYRGELPTFKLLGRTLIRADDLERLVNTASGRVAA